jgi:hypothetical protein
VRRVLILAILILPGIALAGTPAASWTLQASVYNTHYNSNPKHLRYSPLLGLEVERRDRWLAGGALFRNSFGQFSQMAYVGRRDQLFDGPFHVKWVAGVLHGYRGRYRNKVPYNYRGFSPAVLPSLGFSHGRFRTEAQFFWTNGLMITAGFTFAP